MPPRLTPQRAEILGLQALGWLAGDPDRLGRFLVASGTEAAHLRQSAGDPALLGAVLEFLLANEDLLQAFCQEGAIAPTDIHIARATLEGPCG
jgi:hypothetical protein